MPKATLEFDLPDDAEEFKHATNATQYLLALQALASAFRDKDKYAPEETTTWDEVRKLFWDTIAYEGVELD